eukprot:COSAG01_NODE_115_length_25561_cov_103.183450_12_plen_109_part_00
MCGAVGARPKHRRRWRWPSQPSREAGCCLSVCPSVRLSVWPSYVFEYGCARGCVNCCAAVLHIVAGPAARRPGMAGWARARVHVLLDLRVPTSYCSCSYTVRLHCTAG